MVRENMSGFGRHSRKSLVLFGNLNELKAWMAAAGYTWRGFNTSGQTLNFENLSYRGEVIPPLHPLSSFDVRSTAWYQGKSWDLSNVPDPRSCPRLLWHWRVRRAAARQNLALPSPHLGLTLAHMAATTRIIDAPAWAYELHRVADRALVQLKEVRESGLNTSGMMDCAVDVSTSADYVMERLWHLAGLACELPTLPGEEFEKLVELGQALRDRTDDLRRYLKAARREEASLTVSSLDGTAGDEAMLELLQGSRHDDVRALTFPGSEQDANLKALG